jgi:hypothetical protein
VISSHVIQAAATNNELNASGQTSNDDVVVDIRSPTLNKNQARENKSLLIEPVSLQNVKSEQKQALMGLS